MFLREGGLRIETRLPGSSGVAASTLVQLDGDIVTVFDDGHDAGELSRRHHSRVAAALADVHAWLVSVTRLARLCAISLVALALIPMGFGGRDLWEEPTAVGVGGVVIGIVWAWAAPIVGRQLARRLVGLRTPAAAGPP